MRTLSKVTFPPALALSLSSLLWAGNFIVGRALRDEIQAVPLNYWRWLIAALILLPFSFKAVRKHAGMILRHWKFLSFLALTGIAGFHIGVYQALHTTTAVNATLFLSMSPVMIIVGSRLVYQDQIKPRQLLGITVSLLGVIALLTHGEPERLLALQFNVGDLWMLLSVTLWSMYSVILKKKPAELPQPVLLNATVLYGLVMMTPLFLMTRSAGLGFTLSTSALLGLLYISVFASVVAYFCWNYGVSRLGPNRAGSFLHLIPLFGAILSLLFLGEGVQGYHIIGALFIGGGILLTSRS